MLAAESYGSYCRIHRFSSDGEYAAFIAGSLNSFHDGVGSGAYFYCGYYTYDLPDTGMSVYTEEGGDVLLVADKCNNRVRKVLRQLY